MDKTARGACATMIFHRIFLIVALAALCGCQRMESTEFGVRFRRLPPYFFGGISSQVVKPGEVTFLLPWDSIYRFDTTVKNIFWGRSPKDDSTANAVDREDYLHTRALDGNEVALAVTLRYRVIPDPKLLTKLVEQVATDDDGVRNVVAAIGQADIRTYLNRLSTEKFLDKPARYKAVDMAQAAMQQRLRPLGIEIEHINLEDFRFEHLSRDGKLDTSYQDKLTEIQKLHQETDGERSRMETVRAKKLQELNNAVAVVNRQVAEAEGYKNQAKLRGEGYYQTKSNEALGILATGQAEVTGIIEQVNALGGPGGEAILKLELARQLERANPQFVLMGESTNPSSVEVKRVDTNELLNQIGVLEGLRSEPKAPVTILPKVKIPPVASALKKEKEEGK